MQPKVIYSWSNNARSSGLCKPEIFGKTIQVLIEKLGGGVTAADIVNAATPASSPLHDLIFKSGEKQAVHLYRKDIARYYLRNCRWRRWPGEEPKIAFVYIKATRRYEPFMVVRSDAKKREDAEESCLHLLVGLLKRFGWLGGDFSTIFKAIERLAKRRGITT